MDSNEVTKTAYSKANINILKREFLFVHVCGNQLLALAAPVVANSTLANFNCHHKVRVESVWYRDGRERGNEKSEYEQMSLPSEYAHNTLRANRIK
ncbi:hypothetical protein ACTXT7_005846 [Hymenolepis weldensis]